MLRAQKEIECPKREAEHAVQLLEALLVAGMQRGEALKKVAEIYSPPRVTSEMRDTRWAKLGIGPGMSFDLIKDEEGRSWNFSNMQDRAAVRRKI